MNTGYKIAHSQVEETSINHQDNEQGGQASSTLYQSELTLISNESIEPQAIQQTETIMGSADVVSSNSLGHCCSDEQFFLYTSSPIYSPTGHSSSSRNPIKHSSVQE